MSTFRTSRTNIVPCTIDHMQDILTMFAEPDSNKYIAPLLAMDHDQWVDKLTTNIGKNKEMVQYWCVYHIENGDFIGTLNLNKFANTEYDQIGIHLSRKYWNQGFGKELCPPILDYGFNTRKLDVIHWVFEPEHEVSKKLAISLGFKPFTEMEDEWGKIEIYQLKN